jgi:hypothetical protein
MLEVLVEAIKDAIASQIVFNVTWWVMVPSPDVTSPAQTLQRWMLPITALIATGGILWQALLMILTRRGEPLVNVLKGLTAVAMWGAVAVAGTNLLLAFSDTYSTWVLTTGLDGSTDKLAERMLTMLAITPSVGLALVSSPLVMLAMVFQLVLLMFRNGAVVILTGLLQLAAAGTFTNGTSAWLRKLLSWHLALVFYKPMAATIYAIAFMLIGDRGNQLQTWLTGVGMLAMSIIALPAMLRFLNWSVGGIQSSSGGLGMLAAAGAAGIHGAASLRGVTDHARDMERRYTPGLASPPGSTATGTGTSTATPPAYTGPPPGTTPATPTPATVPAAAGAPAGGTAAMAGTGAASGAGATTTGAAAAASGPAAPVVAGAVVVGQATIGAVRKTADSSTLDGAR